MKKITYFLLAFICLPVVFLSFGCAAQKNQEVSKNSVDAILSQMTIEEKVGQMTQINLDVVCEGEIYKLVEPHHIDPAKLSTAIAKWHVGSVLNCGGHAYPLEQWHDLIGKIQKAALTESRLKVPILYGIDAIHGANYVMKGTLFPQEVAQAATFSPELTYRASAITAYETRAAGIPWNFSPVLDVARNPNWSRFFETYGEDPLVCSRFGVSAIRGYQGSASTVDGQHVAACMKHFFGYSGARTGKDRTPAYLSEIEMREIYLPSFIAAIREGAMSVMINSGEINGVPVHANPVLLTELLRNELGFQGVAVTDWEDVMKLHSIHHVSSGMKESVKLAVLAGIDMCMVPNDFEFSKYLIELVKEGAIPESRLDVSVKRILTMKKNLGLFENPNPPALKDFPNFASKEFQTAALTTAEESITLLKNDNGILPLNKTQKVLVTGPSANSMTILNGAWTRTWQGTDASFDDASRNTIAEALRLESEQVQFVESATLDQLGNVTEAMEKAKNSDVVVVCLGELPSTEKPGDITELTMPEAQLELVRAMKNSGKKIVLVLVENRPRIIHEIVGMCDAIVMAYQPGDFGGDALAHILYGKVNPSGKLPFTYPAHEQSLLLHDHKHTEELDTKFGNDAFQPEWQFGFGLGYSKIEYSDLKVSKEKFAGNDEVTITVKVSNLGDMPAKESVLIFSHDQVASITPSVKRLRDFTKIELAPKESKVVSFTLKAEDLAFVNASLKKVTEEGWFDIIVGNLSTKIYYGL